MFVKIQEASEYIRNFVKFKPQVGIILGTGLGALADAVEDPIAIPYGDIPYFPLSTVKGHKGQFVFGQLDGVNVMVMQGRFHYYEGYSMQEVTFPVRVMRNLGIKNLFISNAAGGLNESFKVGDLMLIEDHINLTGDNPLIGTNDDRLGVRFPDMSEPYAYDFIEKAENEARSLNIRLRKGVYAGVAGPNIETRAEWKFLRTIGGDAVGMSTVAEVIAARHAGMKVFAVSVITNECKTTSTEEHVSHEAVIEAAEMAGKNLEQLFRKMLLNVTE